MRVRPLPPQAQDAQHGAPLWLEARAPLPQACGLPVITGLLNTREVEPPKRVRRAVRRVRPLLLTKPLQQVAHTLRVPRWGKPLACHRPNSSSPETSA